ncbi:Uncharacterised protein [Yersinia enterocolitica]|nr:Uncharacterised protein [Yersinia enterocolitica]
MHKTRLYHWGGKLHCGGGTAQIETTGLLAAGVKVIKTGSGCANMVTNQVVIIG